MRKPNTQVKVEFGNWQGIWSRGNPDEVPFNHLVDCLNMRFNTLSGLYTREGTSIAIHPFSLPLSVNDWILSKYLNGIYSPPIITSDLLLLDTLANLYLFNSGTLNNLGIMDVTAGRIIVAATNILGVNFFSKTFFCSYLTGAGNPTNIYGINGLRILNGKTFPPIVRLAAGFGPPNIPAMTATDSGTAGNIPEGGRTFYCSFETDTGFLTPLGALVVYTNNSNTNQVDLAVIPLGPPNTIARYILSTQAGGAIPYFIDSADGGIINDNTTTTATVNFFDTDLVDSADYLLNLLPIVGQGIGPGGGSDTYSVAAGCIQFAGRMFVWSGLAPIGLSFDTNYPFDSSSTVLGSRLGDPESYDQTSCYMNVNKDDGFPVITAFVLNNILYFCKKLGVFSTYDNQLEPYQWPISFVDGSISVPPKGIAYLSSNESPVAGAVIIADKSGLLCFNGSFQRPELTWKVESIWKRISQLYWNTVQVAIDTKIKCIYCALPLDGVSSPNYILMGNYSNATDENLNYIDPMKIKWNLWTFPNNPTVIGMIDINTPNYFGDVFPVFRFGSIDGISGIVQLDSNSITDYGTNIPSYIQTAFGYPAKSRSVNMKDINTLYNLMKWNVNGAQLITATAIGYNSAKQRQLFTRVLSNSSGTDLENPINFTSQKISIKLSAAQSYWFIDSIDLYGNLTFLRTPQ